MLLYDITSASSFAGAKRWLSELQAELPPPPQTALVLVGAKLDRQEEREVLHYEARQLARSAKAFHLECSSKDGTNVEAVFEKVATLLLERGVKPNDGSSRLHREPAVGVTMINAGRQSAPVGVVGCCQG